MSVGLYGRRPTRKAVKKVFQAKYITESTDGIKEFYKVEPKENTSDLDHMITAIAA